MKLKQLQPLIDENAYRAWVVEHFHKGEPHFTEPDGGWDYYKPMYMEAFNAAWAQLSEPVQSALISSRLADLSAQLFETAKHLKKLGK